MSRSVSVCLCAVLAFLVLSGARLLNPEPVFAASGTVSMETPLHEAPAHDAAVLALLPEGTVVSIDGPPVDGFYPVSTGALSGWMRGETLLLEKDIPYEEAPVDAPPVATDQPVATAPVEAELPVEAVPAAQTATDGTAPSDAAAPVAPAVEPAPTSDPAAQAPVTDPAAVPTADPTYGEPAPIDPASTVAAPAADATAAPPTDASASDLAADPAQAATPVPVADVSAAPAEGTAAPAPAVTAAATPMPQPELSSTGPASVIVDAPIRVGPAASYDLIFTVPNGSTVQQTGHIVDGYITVQYKEVTGWLALENLGQPSDFVAEAPPEETMEPVQTRTPRPGSGVAFTTVDLSLRDGPSATAEPVVVVPAGSRVVLTGVMEGGFQRVTWSDEIGWVSNDYLTTPADPDPSVGSGNQQNYSRRQIVNIIYAAADHYDQSRSAMLRVAECESNLDPYAVNPSGSYGLFQFIRSTWKSTPFGDQDIFNPEANAKAAAWMWAEGRKSEWVCQ